MAGAAAARAAAAKGGPHPPIVRPAEPGPRRGRPGDPRPLTARPRGLLAPPGRAALRPHSPGWRGRCWPAAPGLDREDAGTRARRGRRRRGEAEGGGLGAERAPAAVAAAPVTRANCVPAPPCVRRGAAARAARRPPGPAPRLASPIPRVPFGRATRPRCTGGGNGGSHIWVVLGGLAVWGTLSHSDPEGGHVWKTPGYAPQDFLRLNRHTALRCLCSQTPFSVRHPSTLISTLRWRWPGLPLGLLTLGSD